MGAQFVLSGLASHEHHKGQTELLDNGMNDPAGYFLLVGTQGSLEQMLAE